MKKYYIVSLKFNGFTDSKITVKAKNKEKAILKASAFLGNSNGRLDFPGPTQEAS